MNAPYQARHHSPAHTVRLHADRAVDAIARIVEALETADHAEGSQLNAARVREIIAARRARDAVFGKGLFDDPAWDMILDLLLAELENRQVSVSSLCIAAAVPDTTALRWIRKLTEAGFFTRVGDPLDGRRAYIYLTEHGSGAIREWFAAGGRTPRGV